MCHAMQRNAARRSYDRYCRDRIDSIDEAPSTHISYSVYRACMSAALAGLALASRRVTITPHVTSAHSPELSRPVGSRKRIADLIFHSLSS